MNKSIVQFSWNLIRIIYKKSLQVMYRYGPVRNPLSKSRLGLPIFGSIFKSYTYRFCCWFSRTFSLDISFQIHSWICKKKLYSKLWRLDLSVSKLFFKSILKFKNSCFSDFSFQFMKLIPLRTEENQIFERNNPSWNLF